ncbi:dicarboxylate/amino acid:cation symporter [Rickettsia japonica]|uniref:Dicarboxylate/amino acid:cation symporter n=2 Tax=Rickettsia japonica TaxID=35790 RepID=A0AAD1CAA4_RICJA|nr:dicarboxylate/amino acid:cation symporter [Rickettsia japonica]AXU06204.1 dicarboxylate/amino acid:cation symporter [Rickettsia japonica]QHE24883.1 cation:dicarboxylase symporter family transporter [Rickettsia japonica]BAK96403.1 Na+/H+-dicarboxylate symporters [Rickettsia japonica YH]BAW82454.1 predicted Na+/H+-dicarboxylate symporter [Rickettsia japonica]
MKLWQKVTLGLILGIIFGIYLPQYVNYIKPIGDIFLRLIKMIITPLIFFSLVSGITSMNDDSALGRVGMKAVAAFLGTTFFATVFGLTVALVLKPGVGVHIDFTSSGTTSRTSFNIIDFFVNIVPDNAVGAFANGDVLQVVFFAIFVGITLNKMKSIGEPITDLIHVMSKLILKMISFVIQLSPYGAFALTGWIVGMQGVEVMISLSKLVVAVVVAMTFQYLVFGLLIFVFCRVSPIPFYKKSFEYQILAFSTSSSKATLATTMQVCREKLGISESSTSFVLPIGASINMDGFAINLSLTTIFFAQMMGVTLAPHDYLVIILTSTLGSIGGAGIPGASLIMLPMVLSSVHLPIEGVAIIAGIDRILDMLRTTINITGDATITMIIDNSEDTLDKEVYLS